MAAKPPSPTPPSRTFSSEPPAAPFAAGSTQESQTVAALQNKLEDARREYALRRYDEVERILRELEIDLQTVTQASSSREPLADRIFLKASVLCLKGRLLSSRRARADAQKAFTESVRLFESQKSEMEQHKSATRMWTDYGMALSRIGRRQEATELLKRVCESGTAPAEAFGYLAFSYKRDRLFAEAESAFKTALQLAPGDPQLLLYLAQTLDQAGAGKRTEAVSAYYDAALVAADEMDLQTAAQLAHRALEIEPTDVQALNLAVNIEVTGQRLDGALTIVDATLQHDPDHAWALGLKGSLLRISGDLNGAIEILRAIDVQTPELTWVLVELAKTLHELNSDHDTEALKVLDRASELDTEDAGALYVRARIRLDRGENGEAVAALDHAVNINSKSAFLQCELGRALFLSLDLVRAHKAFDAALLLDPKSTAALAGKADVLRVEGKLDEALDLYRRALRLEPENEFVFQAMIDVILAQGRLDEALDLLEAEIARGRQVAWAQWCKGRILLEQKDLNGAVQALESATSLDPANPDLALELAEALQQVDQYDKAGEAYDRALRLQPESPDHMARKAFYLTDIASFEEAHDLLSRALEKDPDQALWWAVQGWCLQHLGKPLVTEARAAFERALSTKRTTEEDEDDLWFRKGLANTLRRLGQDAEAKSEFERIIREQKYKPGDDALILAALGWCHYQLHRYDEAVRLLHASLSVEEKPSAQFDLGLVLFASSRSTLALSEYHRAIELASRKHVLPQRGLYYIALYDLVQAATEENIGGPDGDAIFELLRNRLMDSGVELNALSWLPDQLPRKPSAKVR